MATSDGQKAYAGGKGGEDDLSAVHSDADGTNFFAGAGDDVLRGGKFNDWLNGAGGNDQYWGGGGADQFRFIGTQTGDGDSDNVYDLNFGDGDTLNLLSFAAGTFNTVGGYNNGSSIEINSVEELRAVIDGSNGTIAAQKGETDVLILTLTTADGDIQTINISNMYAQYSAVGGEGVA